MTTIVADFKNKIMASDTKCSYGQTQFRIQKIYEMSDGTLIGFSGDVTEAKRFVDWWNHGANKACSPIFGDEPFDALVMNDEGIHLWDSHLMSTKINQDFFAVGSGAPFALGALRAGAHAQKAVEIAIQEDSSSGFPLDLKSYIKRTAKRKTVAKKAPPVGARSKAVASKKK